MCVCVCVCVCGFVRVNRHISKQIYQGLEVELGGGLEVVLGGGLEVELGGGACLTLAALSSQACPLCPLLRSPPPLRLLLYIYIYTYIYMYMYVYRERERRRRIPHLCVYSVCTHRWMQLQIETRRVRAGDVRGRGRYDMERYHMETTCWE